MMELLSADIHLASYPWNAEPSVPFNGNEFFVTHLHDSPAQIQDCLNCTMARCINCVENEKNGKYYVKRDNLKQAKCRIRDRIAQMLKEGVRCKDACTELDISVRTYWRYVKQIREAG